MITFLIVGYSIAAFFLGVAFGAPQISLYSLQIFTAYVAACFIDGVFGLLALRRTAGRRSGRPVVRHPMTWVGRQFQSYQEAISYRINSLSDVVDQANETPEVGSPEPTAENEDNFFEQTLGELENAFRPSSCAVLLSNGEEDSLQIFIKGIRGKRLEEQLKIIFSEWFRESDQRWLGTKDTFNVDSSSEELSAFGLRYLVSVPFERDQRRGILWLGFGSSREPSGLTEQRLSDFARTLERQLGTFSQVQELRIRADEAEKVSEARSEFLTHVSHDIKSPLNNIRAILGLLRDEGLSTFDNKDIIGAALRNCDSVAELVDSLIDFAKFRSGKLVANRSVFNLSHLVSEIFESFESTAKAKNLQFSFDTSLAEIRCLADKTQLRRIISNLVSNSLKYTQSGRVHLSIQPRDEHFWTFKIMDTGPGFSDQQLKEIFTPFTRFDAQATEGTGLGLAVSKILAELNGGALELRSVQGAGSEFSVSIPAAAAGEAGAGVPRQDKIIDFSTLQQHAAQQKRAKRLAGLRLLVVDDDPEATQGLARILANEGADAAQATTVPDALSIMNFDDFDVLVTDANMPDGGGRRLIRHVRTHLPSVAVVVTTGDVSKSEELIALGAVCVMDKPVHISELIDYLEDILLSSQQPLSGNQGQ